MRATDIKIRLATPSDAEIYDAFMEAMFAENLDTLPYRSQNTSIDLMRQFLKKCSEDHSALFLAENDDRIIGGIGISRIDQPNRNHVSTLGMNVADGWRGKGIGRAMLSHALAWADATPSVERIELEVTAHNEPAIHLYRAFGFQLEGSKLRAMKKDGKYIDLLVLARMGCTLKGEVSDSFRKV
ncbi:MAG TPA: GNAT family N-acetyltransferase [Burkholderiaceae bacterium]|jgi:putative acetyltransferase